MCMQVATEVDTRHVITKIYCVFGAEKKINYLIKYV